MTPTEAARSLPFSFGKLCARYGGEQPRAPMTHREKDFWLYFLAYLSLGSAFGLIVLGIIDITVGGPKVDLGGAAVGLFVGTLILSALKRKKTDNQGSDPKP
jgi:membrane associated rhomboid family serine protease